MPEAMGLLSLGDKLPSHMSHHFGKMPLINALLIVHPCIAQVQPSILLSHIPLTEWDQSVG